MTDPNGADIYGVDPINIPPMNVSIYTSTMDPMAIGHGHFFGFLFAFSARITGFLKKTMN
jgi:hypothetical protein